MIMSKKKKKLKKVLGFEPKEKDEDLQNIDQEIKDIFNEIIEQMREGKEEED